MAAIGNLDRKVTVQRADVRDGEKIAAVSKELENSVDRLVRQLRVFR